MPPPAAVVGLRAGTAGEAPGLAAPVRDDFLSERAESPLDLAVDFRFFSVRAAELLRESDFFALAIFSGVADGSGVGAAFDSSV